MRLFKKKKKEQKSWTNPDQDDQNVILQPIETNTEKRSQPSKSRLPGFLQKTVSLPRFGSMPRSPRGKIRIPGLRTFKRILGAILFIINGACFFAIAPLEEGIGIFFLLNSFILLDYLWKTRKIKQTAIQG